MKKNNILYLIFFVIILLLFIRFVIAPLLYLALVIFVYIIPTGINVRSFVLYYHVIARNIELYYNKNMRLRIAFLNEVIKQLKSNFNVQKVDGYVEKEGIMLVGEVTEDMISAAVRDVLSGVETKGEGRRSPSKFLTAHFTIALQILLVILILFFGHLTGGSFLITAIISAAGGYGLSFVLEPLIFGGDEFRKMTFAGAKQVSPPGFFYFMGVPFKNNLIRAELR